MAPPRLSGLLLHVTSLPSPFGIGDLGPAAFRFADFLAQTRQQLWQVLPLVPVAYGYSPYSSPSTFAGNPLLISPDRLVEEGILRQEDLSDRPDFPEDRVDFEHAVPFKFGVLERAFARFEDGETGLNPADFEGFCAQEADWLEDYALFMALKSEYGDGVWTAWPHELAHRHGEALRHAHHMHARAVRLHKFWQFLFARQWNALHQYCHERGIRIFGDLPIYVAHDSADCWANPDLFFLDEQGHPTVVAGVPPDYFSETGQRWGNPLYRWKRMRERGYTWWTRRLARTFKLYDLVRLDHFRGFAGYWEVPAEEETAVNGRWVEGPGASLFDTLRHNLGSLPVVAENLGVITPDVTALMEQQHFPGMAVLQFAFDSDATSDFLPHNYQPSLVAYTGTHDNDTIIGWWDDLPTSQPRHDGSLAGTGKAYARAYLGLGEGDEDVHWAFIRAAMASVASLVVIPLQDLLGTGSEGRMNVPGRESDNWAWRFAQDALSKGVADRLRTLTEVYGRTDRE